MVWQIPVAMGVKSLYDGAKGAKRARKAGRASARLILEETKENVRRERLTLGQMLGQGQAAVSASGLRASGTPQNYLDFLETEGNRNINWMERSGMMRARAARKGANMTATATMNQGLQATANSGLQAYDLYKRYN